ncbi:ABC transporter ATP-binding protein [Malacoplasma iowae]|uniref:ABC transporter ATP-binding protein n=1 Tax=Malacoplasma iowae 695 TaxID=1048830 RepID=A0A6P1LDL5_MALIO|nr:ABC transporter ATP-binding protein [Malacoplasma iowae]VEU62243.1 ABC transporter ATP-binding protein [Mycoplasmopsis fermentans]EGZ31652.1 methylgalactoside permease ATP-binding protein [Malacoplasma iowae 695]QHG90297.2 ABC transporter ATP-binding protein [Malacoplasma iowae 695]WPL35290.1 ABC transporter ATP-binding protein [Malacoplasma iowae]VEU72486.1 ABC transporter ATP-binding protein [Malacoplasma iowae]
MNTENKKIAVKLENISKSFLDGKVKANQNINIDVLHNEVHALIGENGAGKSTLMSILFGIYEQDEGNIYINGEKVRFQSAKDAQRYKIGMVHQHFKLVDNYSVLQNVILGSEPVISKSFTFINKKQAIKKLNELIKKYNFNLNIYDKVQNLTVGQQQKVEILKLLYRDSDILIFDEPTAVLSDDEIKSFLDMIKDFKSSGKTIIIITHKLNEIKEVADNCTVIRHGKVVDKFLTKDTTIEKMAEAMVGRSLKNISNQSSINFENNETIVEIKNLPLALMSNPSVKFSKNKIISDLYAKIRISERINKIKEWWYKLLVGMKFDKFMYLKKPEELDFTLPTINLKIRAGEILAIAGVEGNGQSQLVEYVSGLRKSPENTIVYNNKDSSFKSIKWRYKFGGLSFVPEDRHKHGLFLDDSVMFNSVSNQMYDKSYNNYGFIATNSIKNHALNVINEFDVRGVGSIDDSVRGLSGGNQQKLIIGREINKNSKFIIFTQPTRGLDVGAIEYIHSRILQAKEEGKAILLVSYELDEILALADTIAVMSKNQIVGIGPRKEMTRNKIGLLMAHGGSKNTDQDNKEGVVS